MESKAFNDIIVNQKRTGMFWKILLSLANFMYGYYYLSQSMGVVITTDPVFHFLSARLIGVSLMILSVMYGIGILSTKAVGFYYLGYVGMTFVWGGLFVSSLWFVVNGYPLSVWLDKCLMMMICIGLSGYRFEREVWK